MAKLVDKDRAIVIKLKEWAGSIAHKVIDASRKIKCTSPLFGFHIGSMLINLSEGSDKKHKPKEIKKPTPTESVPVFTKKENATLAQ